MRSDFPTAARVRVREKRRPRAAVEKSSTQKFGYFRPTFCAASPLGRFC